MATVDPARLLFQLQNTGLQNKDNQLYQLLSQMIGIITGLNSATNRLSGIPSGGTVINVLGFPPMLTDTDGGSPNEMLSIPGRDGTIGRDGTMGAPGYDGQDGLDGEVILGPIGPAGPMVPYYLGDNERFLVPLYKQALFSMNIELDGSAILEVEGYLIEVLDECCDVPAPPVFIESGDNYEENIFLLNDELVWHSVAYADCTFTANGGATWTVASGDFIYYKWARKGKVLFIKGAIINTTVTGAGAGTTELRVSAPPGIVFAGNDSFGFTVYSEVGFVGAGADTGQSIAGVSTGLMTFKTRTSAPWINTADLTGVIWNLVVEIS